MFIMTLPLVETSLVCSYTYPLVFHWNLPHTVSSVFILFETRAVVVQR